jgi:hypothetical protein
LIDNRLVYCRKSTDLSWEGDEHAVVVAEEEAAPPAEELKDRLGDQRGGE